MPVMCIGGNCVGIRGGGGPAGRGISSESSLSSESSSLSRAPGGGPSGMTISSSLPSSSSSLSSIPRPSQPPPPLSSSLVGVVDVEMDVLFSRYGMPGGGAPNGLYVGS